jgi:SpoVK/Ycf46/Vps4 family AAA+-type ATPase
MQVNSLPTLFNPIVHGQIGSGGFHRYFFLYGKILDDEFCTPDGRIMGLEALLHQHLGDIGFHRVVFFNGTKKIYFRDQAAWNSVMQREVPRESTANRRRDDRLQVLGGPLGRKKIGGQRPPTPTPETATSPPENTASGDWSLDRMSDIEASRFLDKIVGDSAHRSAVVFTNLHDLIHFTDPEAQRQFTGNLEHWRYLPSNNHNIIIFMAPLLSMGDIRETIGRTPHWAILNSLIFTDTQQGQVGENVIAVGSPRRDEVQNLFNRVRLLRKLPVDWLQFDHLIDQVSRHWLNRAAGQGERKFSDLVRRLEHIPTLDNAGLAPLLGKAESGTAMERLQNMRGLEAVANRVGRIIKRINSRLGENKSSSVAEVSINVDRLRPRRANPVKGENLHMALMGHPGTGKTTSARLIAEAFREAGLLESGHLVEVSEEHLVAGYVGQTAIQTAQRINDAMGGVLFIDEVQRFADNSGSGADFKREAIQTLLGAMENHKGEFAVIVATYPDQMERFLKLDDGLPSRFSASNTIEIPDYAPDVLEHIFRQSVVQQQLLLAPELEAELSGFFHNWFTDRNPADFGNARDVKELVLKGMDERRLERVEQQDISPGSEEYRQLVVADIPDALKKHFKPARCDNPDTVMEELNQLIGLRSVKQLVTTQIRRLQVQKLRGISVGLVPGHYLFTGNPGTGKTTVARLMGKVFRSLGLLKKGHVVEVKRADLVAGYVGQTSLKTQEKIKEALDGILFIDEAYQLEQGEGGSNSFGREAIETLVADMENERHRLCIIAAGYPAPMRQFITSNPGLKSRFTAEILFEDFSSDELLAIFKLDAGKLGLILGDGVEDALIAVFTRWLQVTDEHFGNARDVRKLLVMMQDMQDARIMQSSQEQQAGQDFFIRFEVVDIPAALI